jgi:hypothetical protein
MRQLNCPNCNRKVSKFIVGHRMGWGMVWSKWKCKICGAPLEFTFRSKILYLSTFLGFCIISLFLKLYINIHEDWIGISLIVSVFLTEIISRNFITIQKTMD